MSTAGTGMQPVTQPLPTATAAARADLTAILQRGSSWFFWIAALSMVNTFTLLSGSRWNFLAGLGITQIVTALAKQAGGQAPVFAILVNTVGAAAFLLFGVFARKGSKGAFLTGMVLYGLDALVILLFKDWLVIAFHAYVLYRLFLGFKACDQTRAFENA